MLIIGLENPFIVDICIEDPIGIAVLILIELTTNELITIESANELIKLAYKLLIELVSIVCVLNELNDPNAPIIAFVLMLFVFNVLISPYTPMK
jgi:hypothetical protein